MTTRIAAAALAVGLALSASTGSAGAVSFVQTFNDVRIMSGVAPFDAASVANGFCTGKGFVGTTGYQLMRFSKRMPGPGGMAIYAFVSCRAEVTRAPGGVFNP